MHFAVLLIHEKDEQDIMGKRYYDAVHSDGAQIYFNVCSTKNEFEAEYKNGIKDESISLEDYPTIQKYADEYYGYKHNKKGDYGYHQNKLGIYDWYEVGGRWKGCLPALSSEKELKKELKKALNLKDEKIAEKYRDNVEEYVRLNEMPLHKACASLDIGGTHVMEIKEEITSEFIIEWVRNIGECWSGGVKEKDAIHSMFNGMIVEKNGKEKAYLDNHENVNETFFKEQYDARVKESKKTGKIFYLTVIDCHT